MPRYLDDFSTGESDTYGNYTLTEREIVEFAERYDPQQMHTDPHAAERSHYDGVVASGWQTACIAMRLAVEEGYLRDAAVVAGVGVEGLRWKRPVRPGDTLRVREEIVGKRPSESDPDRGILEIEIQVFTQNGTEVLSMRWIDIVERVGERG
jgi:acyl dehydratase